MKNQPVKVLQQVVNHSNALDARFGFQSNKAKEAFLPTLRTCAKNLRLLVIPILGSLSWVSITSVKLSVLHIQVQLRNIWISCSLESDSSSNQEIDAVSLFKC